MRETLKSELEQMLSAYDRKREETQNEARRLKEEEEAFVNQYREVRAGLLRPCLHDFGEALRQRGHDYQITEEDESVGRDGRPRSARIILTLHLTRPDAPPNRPVYSPAVAFAASRRRRKVCVYVRIPPSNEGSSSPRAEYPLEQLTTAVIEAELVKALKDILGT